MFEFLTASKNDAIELIKHDHENVKDLFDRFEKADELREKRKIVADILLELKLHAAVEEEIFYAEVRPQIEKKIMNEADEEHHVAKLLIAELEVMNGTESHYDAKVKVLSENIRHHIREEESDMLPKARGLSIDYDVMGEQILARKEVLKRTGVPTFAEENMVKAIRNRGDSPAQNARITKKPAKPAASKKPIANAKKMVKATAKKAKSNVIKLSSASKKLATKTSKAMKSNTKKLLRTAAKATGKVAPKSGDAKKSSAKPAARKVVAAKMSHARKAKPAHRSSR